MSLLAVALGYAGIVCFAFAMTAHHRTVFGRAPEPRRSRRFRVGGTVLLLAALAVIVRAYGSQVGVVAWIALLSISGFGVTQLLAYAPRFTIAAVAPLFFFALLAVLHQ